MKVLHHTSDLRSVSFVAAALAILALSWSGVIGGPVCFGLACVMVFIACVANHNHQHRPTWTHGPMNWIYGAMLTLATGQPASAIVPMHNRNHHVHNNSLDDFVRSSAVSFRWNLLNLVLFPFVAALRYLPEKHRILTEWRLLEPARYRQLRFERVVSLGAAFIVLAFDPRATVVWLGGPYLFGQWAIVTINLLQHDGCDPSSDYDHSRNFTGTVLNWWLLNNGYHTAHHMCPGVHWSQLPRLHEEIRDRVDPRLERRSLVGAVLEFYFWPGRRPRPRGATA